MLLFSNKEKYFIVQVCYEKKTHSQAVELNWSRELWHRCFETKEEVGQKGAGGLCWNLSKANNHSGAGEEYYIRVPNQYHITLSMGVYTRLIKLIIFDATMAVSFAGALDNNYCSIIGAVCELKKKGRNTTRQMDIYLTKIKPCLE